MYNGMYKERMFKAKVSHKLESPEKGVMGSTRLLVNYSRECCWTEHYVDTVIEKDYDNYRVDITYKLKKAEDGIGASLPICRQSEISLPLTANLNKWELNVYTQINEDRPVLEYKSPLLKSLA